MARVLYMSLSMYILILTILYIEDLLIQTSFKILVKICAS